MCARLPNKYLSLHFNRLARALFLLFSFIFFLSFFCVAVIVDVGFGTRQNPSEVGKYFEPPNKDQIRRDISKLSHGSSKPKTKEQEQEQEQTSNKRAILRYSCRNKGP